MKKEKKTLETFAWFCRNLAVWQFKTCIMIFFLLFAVGVIGLPSLFGVWYFSPNAVNIDQAWHQYMQVWENIWTPLHLTIVQWGWLGQLIYENGTPLLFFIALSLPFFLVGYLLLRLALKLRF